SHGSEASRRRAGTFRGPGPARVLRDDLHLEGALPLDDDVLGLGEPGSKPGRDEVVRVVPAVQEDDELLEGANAAPNPGTSGTAPEHDGLEPAGPGRNPHLHRGDDVGAAILWGERGLDRDPTAGPGTQHPPLCELGLKRA